MGNFTIFKANYQLYLFQSLRCQWKHIYKRLQSFILTYYIYFYAIATLIIDVTTLIKWKFKYSFKNFWAVNLNIHFKFSGLYLNYSLAASFVRCKLMSGYKDRENEGLGPRRASFPYYQKAGQKG